MLNPSMSKRQRQILYLATITALGSAKENFVLSDESDDGDGYKLWQTLDTVYLDDKVPMITKQDLLKSFLSMTKNTN